ncbi:VWD domain-containing protein, partial [Cellulomonas phragmiteti]
MSGAAALPGLFASCDPADEDRNSRDLRCLNGSQLRTRGYNHCLTNRDPGFNGIYYPNQCYGLGSSNEYIESIAHARLVQRMNLLQGAVNPGVGVRGGAVDAAARQASGVVTSRIQWEVNLTRLPGGAAVGRPDVVVQGGGWSNPVTNSVQVIEVKGDWNGGTAAATTQVGTYVATMRSAGWAGAVAPDTSWYVDQFRVVYECRKGTATRPVYDRYAVSGPAAGVVLVTKVNSEPCRSDEKRQRYADEKRAVKDIPQIDDIPVEPPVTQNPYEPEEPVDVDVPEHEVGWDPTPIVIGVGVGIADVAVRYTYQRALERAAVRAAEQIAREAADAGTRAALRRGVRAAAFESTRDAICLGPVNTATRTHTSVSPAALACRELTKLADLIDLLHTLGDLGFTLEDLLAMGLTEEEAALVLASATSPAQVRADPRLVTLDGLNYDFHGVGEYRLLQHAPSGLEIQMRTVPATADMSSVGAIAVATSEHVIELGATGAITLDGSAFTLENGAFALLSEGVVLRRAAGRIEVLTAFDDRTTAQAVVSWTPQPGARGDFAISLPRSWAGEVTGMLGDFDGNPHDDLVSASGVDVTPGLRFGVSDALFLQRLYGTFGDSWRATDATALFTYPAGRSTQDYTDRSYPRGVTTLGDLSPERFALAAGICRAAGVSEGLGFDDCILDVGFSGDASFATSLASRDTFGVGLGDAFLGEGPLRVGFVGSIPPNFFPGKVQLLGGGRNYAGPFTVGNAYPFYLNDLPGHSAFSLAVDVVTTGINAPAPPVELLLDGQRVAGTAVPGSAESVTLASGELATVVRMVFTVAHSKRDTVGQLRLTSGSAWFGVERLEIDVTRVPFERFDVELRDDREFRPTHLPATSGAGVLEAAGSSDRYCFDIPEGRTLGISGNYLRSDLTWRLRSTDGSFATRNGERVYTQLEGLAGPACLEVFVAGNSVPNAWRYDIGLLVVPGAQVFEVDPGAGVVEV